eukprot:1477595-Amphidinium_carterae.2
MTAAPTMRSKLHTSVICSLQRSKGNAIAACSCALGIVVGGNTFAHFITLPSPVFFVASQVSRHFALAFAALSL